MIIVTTMDGWIDIMDGSICGIIQILWFFMNQDSVVLQKFGVTMILQRQIVTRSYSAPVILGHSHVTRNLV